MRNEIRKLEMKFFSEKNRTKRRDDHFVSSIFGKRSNVHPFFVSALLY